MFLAYAKYLICLTLPLHYETECEQQMHLQGTDAFHDGINNNNNNNNFIYPGKDRSVDQDID